MRRSWSACGIYGVLDIVVDVLSIAGLALALLRAPGGRKRMLVIASTFLPVVLCTCPGCFGNAPSCTYDTNGKCPTIVRPIPKYMKVYAQWAWVCIAMHYL